MSRLVLGRHWLAGLAAGAAPRDVLYHATFAFALPSIAESGLVPGNASGLGRDAGYNTWSRGRVFLTGDRDLMFWFSRMEEHAFDRYDDMREAKSLPVVLRVRKLRRELERDEVAERESMTTDSWRVRRRIPPRQLDVWDGKRWRPVSEFSDDDEVQALVDANTDEESGVRDVVRPTRGGPVRRPVTLPIEGGVAGRARPSKKKGSRRRPVRAVRS